MIILKFGGTSVADAQAICRMMSIVEDRLNKEPLIVVSALSNRLMETPLELEKREVLQRIEVQDIEMGYRKMKPKTAVEGISRRRIGFVA